MNSDELNKRREAAAQAMESDLQRHMRESRAELSRRQVAAGEARIDAERARLAETKRREEEAAAAEGRRRQAEAADKQARTSQIARAGQMVESLKSEYLHLDPLRTFKGDMARAVKEEGLSLSKIAITGQGFRGGPSPAPRRLGLSGWLVAPLALAAAGALAYFVYFYYFSPPPAPDTKTNATPAPLIFTEANTAVPLETASGGEAVRNLINQEAAQTNFGAPAIKNLYFTRGGQIIGWNIFRQATELELPADLSRTLGDEFMFGVYYNGNAISRFLIIEPKLFELAYSGMWQWERTMVDEAFPLINGRPPGSDDRGQGFTDKLVHNKDTRLLKNRSGETVLFYGFLDPRHLVITRDEETFLEILKRFTAGAN